MIEHTAFVEKSFVEYILLFETFAATISWTVDQSRKKVCLKK